jgi:hypothetical protein
VGSNPAERATPITGGTWGGSDQRCPAPFLVSRRTSSGRRTADKGASVRKATLLCGMAFVAAAVLAVLAPACDDGDEKAKTPTPAATASATATPASLDIRDVDLIRQPDVEALLQRLGGEVSPEDVLYADLTGDGQEEAIVPISSGGTAGNLAFIVLGYRGGELVTLLSEVPAEGSVQVEIEDHHLVEVLPLYGSGDTPGFPSRIKKVHYIWKDDALVVDREDVVDNPNASPKE